MGVIGVVGDGDRESRESWEPWGTREMGEAELFALTFRGSPYLKPLCITHTLKKNNFPGISHFDLETYYAPLSPRQMPKNYALEMYRQGLVGFSCLNWEQTTAEGIYYAGYGLLSLT